MSTPTDPQREHPSTYFVQDRENLDEITRLRLQDQMITAGMGGVLPEQPDPTRFKHILDVGCGTGGWLIAAAKQYPTMKRLVGVDVSSRMLDYARAQAAAEKVDDRVQFYVMDALRMLEFPNASFDLINQRFGASFLRTWDWPKILQEYQRVCRPGGIIRITESDLGPSSSPAHTRLIELLLHASSQAGNLFKEQPDGVTCHLADLLKEHGLEQVQTQPYTLHFSSNTSEGQLYAEDTRRVFRIILPFLRKWTHVPPDYEEIYQQAVVETQQPDFRAEWPLLTAWGLRKHGYSQTEQEER